MGSKKHIRIGLDLDGVLVDKPPFVPKRLLEWLVRGHKNKRLTYRYPALRFERWLRWFSHHPIFRPPIRENLEFIKKISKKKEYELYLISGRYSFLEDRTWKWLRRYQIDGLFEQVSINLADEQPHLFKEKAIKDLKINFFIDDDLPLAKYLANSTPRVEIFCFDQKRKRQSFSSVSLINALEEIFDQ